MNAHAPFGFVTGCHAGDKFLVQATLASIRHFCPSVPICLIVDGTFDISDLQRDYDVIVLRIADLPSGEMRDLIAGNPRAKLAAMWEGPFEFFVWLDSDAIVWGDFTPQVRTELDFQIFWTEIFTPSDASQIPDWLRHHYFDPKILCRFDPTFQWRGLAYFSSGTFACRKNVIPFERWMESELLRKKESGIFGPFYDMPLLNYLVHSMTQRGELNAGMADLQYIWTHHGTDELEADCANIGWNFPSVVKRPRVAHFCGRKPSTLDRKSYSRPFTIARLEHYRRQYGEFNAWRQILIEDSFVIGRRAVGRLKRFTQHRKVF